MMSSGKTQPIFSELVQIAEKLGYPIKFERHEYSLGGFINEDGITLNQNHIECDQIGTLIHEISHGLLGHVEDLKSENPIPQDRREQQAETLCYLICQSFGIDRRSEYYLKGWGTTEEILKDFSKINQAFRKFSDVAESVMNPETAVA